ncbi:haloacid dehalogenase [Tenacibaculum holothuriorum]|uniref:Haloacid dehalogenase n=1 Tax=Tenacibaculum holothuriorum TaxID=1635173 RepID=A0A1Y2PDD7_9FLAO|nr:YjjG family noncanonical pyrimidine nucleotidase [Tenacibaculum holothuriorum]OSY88493.1 haloacid dehalogenase [Tenacibaculum holothuriorum]
MMQVKNIFFDLDHTLWDFDRNSRLTFQQIFEEQKLPIALHDFLEVYIPINLSYWRLYREDKIDKKTLRYKRLKDVFDKLNFNASDKLINTISEDYIKYLPNHNYLFEDTIEVLDYLKEKYQLHIITNGFEEVQSLKLQKSGIAKYFKEIVTSESVGVKKPNPKIFEYALSITQAVPEESIMIGDSYEADIMGAIETGMLAIYFNQNSEKESGVVSVNSLLDLKQYL